jgi:hypothetical protein
MPVYWWVYSTQKIDVISSSGTLVFSQQTAWCYIPEDSTLHNHCCKNIKSYNPEYVSTDIRYFIRIFSLPVAYVRYVDVSKTWLIHTNDYT